MSLKYEPSSDTLDPKPETPKQEEKKSGKQALFGDREKRMQAALQATLHPTPYTLHPAHYTLHPTPCTLHPARCTLHLHPAPYTIIPTPSTLNPEP